MSTTAKFSLDNPYYAWPKNPEMDVQILIQKLNELRGKCSSEEWKTRVILNPNDVLRQIEKKKISAIFVCSNDLKYAVHVSHFPFLCRLNGTKLITLKAGSYVELQSYFRKKNLFMFAITCDHEMMEFSKQFPEIESFDAATLPLTTIKK